jgi:methionyl-tRNA formyltransferase
MVRGLSPYPGAFSEVILPGKGLQKLKIFRSHPEPGPQDILPGTFVTDRKSYLKVAARNGFIRLDELQLPGRKVIKSGDFLRGFGKFFPETHAI